MNFLCAGDGRNDSPGFSAQYCTYTMMSEEKDILAIKTIDKRHVSGKSPNMEKLGFVQCLDGIKQYAIVTDVCTDQHSQITALMSELRYIKESDFKCLIKLKSFV